MTKAIENECGGLKCDAPGCDWSDMTITRAEYPKYRNAPCPSCGANILNDADWRTLRRLEGVVWILNLLFFWVKPKPGAVESVTEVRFDGTGKVKVVK
jgi:uncharacterized paraquat-inducible protein A